uniref:Uncharacterized protein n=1 Tax=Anguilla anguilla TaxID=7936 RepID=A0A0E9P8W5_ANGAN
MEHLKYIAKPGICQYVDQINLNIFLNIYALTYC